ncbi:MAG: terpene cyclase/mutase family protein [Pirellulales bacterium]|nr:terpene cyclase/mutase family protein [Pirellulales bacterium]
MALIILSLVILATPSSEPLWVSGGFETASTDDVSVDLSEIPSEAIGEPSLGPVEIGNSYSLLGPRDAALGSPAGVSPIPAIGGRAAANLAAEALAPTGEVAAGQLEAFANPLASRGGGLDGRRLENRRAAALSGGGTAASEDAVERALAWFAEHQYPDGGWRFDLEKCPGCQGACRNAGSHTSSTAATGLALLSFLGAGYTHQEGKYDHVVSKGLYYLREHMTITSQGGDLRDKSAELELTLPAGKLLSAIDLAANARRDSMYSHGIASLALTEAYAMTRDAGLREPAEQTVKFIINAQYSDGGWRYEPRWEGPARGDMTVSGWQIAVLKSASLAGIDVPYDVWMKINDFLDGIQSDGGATYLYLPGERGTKATTAIGLLCRMVTGWPREHQPLQRGAVKLGGQSPQRNNMYFNYYASQVLHHVGGPNWQKWNPKMRDYLVESQSRDGHEAGSWYFAEQHSTPGGRLYTTAMAAMTLEVYYRYMPLYQESFVDRGR